MIGEGLCKVPSAVLQVKKRIAASLEKWRQFLVQVE
jgi:hypothetical protein